MQKINVLELIGSLKIGGAEKQVIGLTRKIDKDRFNVMVCCLGGGGILEEELDGEDVDIVCLNFRTRFFFVALFKLIRLIRRKKIDVLHAHLYNCGLWGRIAAVMTGVPVVIYTEQGKCLWKRRRHILFERLANHFTDMRISVSEDIRNLCMERENTPPEKVTFIPNAINVEDFDVPPERRVEKRKELGLEEDHIVIGTVARLNPAKALDYLLKAFAVVRDSFPAARCIIAGDGSERKYLEECSGELGIEEDTMFLGARTDIPELLSIMDVFVLSSLREGTPVSLLEAVVAGVPSVGTSVGGIPEVIEDEVSGILVPPEDSEKLARGIIKLLKDEDLREEVKRNAYEKVAANYSLTSTSRRIEELYQKFYREKKGNK